MARAAARGTSGAACPGCCTARSGISRCRHPGELDIISAAPAVHAPQATAHLSTAAAGATCSGTATECSLRCACPAQHTRHCCLPRRSLGTNRAGAWKRERLQRALRSPCCAGPTAWCFLDACPPDVPITQPSSDAGPGFGLGRCRVVVWHSMRRRAKPRPLPLAPSPFPLQRGRFKYMGQWEADLQQGEGKCIYADGAQYDGGWQAGMRCALRCRRHMLMAGLPAAASLSTLCMRGAKAAQMHPLLQKGHSGHGLPASRGPAGPLLPRSCLLACFPSRCWLAFSQSVSSQRNSGHSLCKPSRACRHGRGKLKVGNYQYEGEWRQDRQHGAGSCQTESGDRYTGEQASDWWHGGSWPRVPVLCQQGGRFSQEPAVAAEGVSLCLCAAVWLEACPTPIQGWPGAVHSHLQPDACWPCTCRRRVC